MKKCFFQSFLVHLVQMTLGVTLLWAKPSDSVEELLENLAEPSFKSVVELLEDYVPKMWSRTGEIWQGTDWSHHVFIITDHQKAYAISTSGKKEINLSFIPERMVTNAKNGFGSFEKIEFEGNNAIVVDYVPPPQITKEQLKESFPDLDEEQLKEMLATALPQQIDALDRYASFGSHELFHLLEQEVNTASKAEQSSRATLYPPQTQPRVLRRILFDTLMQAYQSPEQREQHLATAKSLLNQWKNLYPDEYRQTRLNENIEGVASYFELSLAVLYETQSPLQSQKFRQGVVKRLNSKNWQYLIGAELYPIGTIATFLLREESQNWQDLLTNLDSPLDLLLQNVQPTPEPEKTRNYDNYSAQMEESFAPFKAELEDTWDTLKNKEDFVKVFLPPNNLMSMSGVFKIKGYEDLEVLLYYSGSGTSGQNSFEITNKTVFATKQLTCGMQGAIPVNLFLYVPKNQIQKKDNQLTIHWQNSYSYHDPNQGFWTPENFLAKIQYEIGQEGDDWICPNVN